MCDCGGMTACGVVVHKDRKDTSPDYCSGLTAATTFGWAGGNTVTAALLQLPGLGHFPGCDDIWRQAAFRRLAGGRGMGGRLCRRAVYRDRQEELQGGTFPFTATV